METNVCFVGKLRAHVLRTNSKTELVTKLGELKKTLSEVCSFASVLEYIFGFL